MDISKITIFLIGLGLGTIIESLYIVSDILRDPDKAEKNIKRMGI